MIEGKTLVAVWEDQKGYVQAEYFFNGMDYQTALQLNLRLDQLKLVLMEAFSGEIGRRPPEDLDGLGVPGGIG